MNKLEKTFLLGFLCIVSLLLTVPYFIPQHILDAIDLSNAFCSPWLCGSLGKGENGIDLFYHVLAGSQIAIILSLLVCLCSMCVGIPLGLYASQSLNRWDHGIMLVTNLFLSFPSILLAIALSAFVGQGLFSTWLILCVTGWAPFCRLARAASLQVQSQDFILASKAIGCSSLRVAFRHILPNILPLLIVQGAFQLSGIIIVESTLSFLGLGVSEETLSLGRLIYTGKEVLLTAPHATLVPGTMILFLVMGFYLSGMALDQAWMKKKAQ